MDVEEIITIFQDVAQQSNFVGCEKMKMVNYISMFLWLKTDILIC